MTWTSFSNNGTLSMHHVPGEQTYWAFGSLTSDTGSDDDVHTSIQSSSLGGDALEYQTPEAGNSAPEHGFLWFLPDDHGH